MPFFAPPKPVLKSLALYTVEIKKVMEQLTGCEVWHTYEDDKDNSADVQILQYQGKYIAILSCDTLCGIEDKQKFLKEAVEFGLHEEKLAINFHDITVTGIVGDEGFMGFLARWRGYIPVANHAYAVCKLPNEDLICIENPRAGLFDLNDKLQPRTDYRICCFASFSLFFFSVLNMINGNKCVSDELLSSIHKMPVLKEKMEIIIKKVGKSTETKDEVINSFIQFLLTFDDLSSYLQPIAASSASICSP